ncbi:hypothetical protein HMSSN036_51680 [Paenibacillus macerans]|nr:hypothetical protein HMSSN036_51680 [Paenibacillus macerans]
MQLTLKVLENFKYEATKYSGNSMTENAKSNADLAATIFNGIYDQILKDQV